MKSTPFPVSQAAKAFKPGGLKNQPPPPDAPDASVRIFDTVGIVAEFIPPSRGYDTNAELQNKIIVQLYGT